MCDHSKAEGQRMREMQEAVKQEMRSMVSDSAKYDGGAVTSPSMMGNNSDPIRHHQSRELLDEAIRDLEKNIRERRSNMECEAKLAHGLRELRNALPTRMSPAAEDALRSMLVAARG